MGRIAENIRSIEAKLGKAQLIVVSKYRSLEEIREAYDAGQRVFAENRVQALLERAEALPSDIEWHLIGHLQTNKVKYIAPFIRLIHSIDSLKLLQEVDKQAAKNQRVIDCLLQVHVAMEETKFGFSKSELVEFLAQGEWKSLEHVRICGLMAMASNTDNEKQVESEFAEVQALFQQVKQAHFAADAAFQHLSTGMSSDYPLALAHGSTLVRIGSAVFA